VDTLRRRVVEARRACEGVIDCTTSTQRLAGSAMSAWAACVRPR
jgi:hypothetical protein